MGVGGAGLDAGYWQGVYPGLSGRAHRAPRLGNCIDRGISRGRALLAGLRAVSRWYGIGCYRGSLLAVYPLGFAAALGLLLSLVLVIRHSARGALFTGLMLAPVFWLLKFPSVVIWIGATTGLVIALRFFEDWNRQYRELWLDRE